MGLTALRKPSERKAQSLAADVLAIRAVVGQVLGRVHQLDPILAEAIQAGFEDAVAQIRRMATNPGKKISERQAAKAIAEVEVLHSAILRRSHRRARLAVADRTGGSPRGRC